MEFGSTHGHGTALTADDNLDLAALDNEEIYAGQPHTGNGNNMFVSLRIKIDSPSNVFGDIHI